MLGKLRVLESKSSTNHTSICSSTKHTLLFSSERIVDDSINIALKTRENLRRDRGTFKAIHSQMTTLASEFSSS